MLCQERDLTMICDIIKIFSQNVQNIWKNSLIVNIILENQMSFNIVFIQEPSWSTICTIPSSTSCEEEKLVGVPHHPNWLTFARSPVNQSDSLKVLTYINICTSCLHFSLQKTFSITETSHVFLSSIKNLSFS